MTIIKDIQIAGSEGRPMLTDIFYTGNTEGKTVVIYAHGFNGFKDWGNFDLIAKQFAEAGFVFVKFNFSHNGTTVEQPEDFVDTEAYANNSYTKELFDLGKIIDWVQDANSGAGPICLLGHSRGGGIVLLKAAEDSRVKAVVTWASVAECKTPWGSWPKERIEQWQSLGVEYYVNGRTGQKLPLYFRLFQDYYQNKERLDIERAIKSLHVPILLCHGTEDPAVGIEKVHLLHKWQPASELFIVDSDHVFGRKHPWNEDILPKVMQQVLGETLSFLKGLE